MAEVDNDRSDNNNRKIMKTTVMRIHSVRQWRARNFSRDGDKNDNTLPHDVEEKSTISSSNSNHDKIVEKNMLTSESPKEIREVEMCHSLVNNNNNNDAKVLESSSTSSSSPPRAPKVELSSYWIKTLEALKLGESATDDNANQTRDVTEDDQDDVVMAVGDESNKRLEGLIARRRSRDLWSINVRRALITLGKRDHPAQIASIVKPKHNSGLNSGNPAERGSAPSVLDPLSNPFDLPYDPQEEKLDLTEDSFQQEFMPSGGTKAEGDDTSSNSEGGFKPRDSLQQPQSSSLGNEFDREFSHTTEEESHEEPKAKSMFPTDSSHEDIDQIKEIIHKEDTDTDDVQTRPNPIPEEGNTVAVDSNSSSSSSSSSSEEDVHVYKIDKEAILKSLSSMVRRRVIEGRNNNKNTINGDVNSHYDDKTVPRRHAHSYSIASDMQVEVSEASSSPPHGIDEGFTYNEGDIIITYDENGNVNKKIGDGDSENSRVCSTEKLSSPEHRISRRSKSVDTITLSNGDDDQLSDGGRDGGIDLHSNIDSSSVSSDALQENEQNS